MEKQTDTYLEARRGVLFVISSPSGAGKTTLCKKLIEDKQNALHLSVSVTTRPPRSNEVDTQDYYFISEEEFIRKKRESAFLESATVFGHFYATPLAQIEEFMAKGQDVLFDIDWQGARQIAEKMPQEVVRIFLLPLSGAILRQRLNNRASDPQEIIEKRMSMSVSELSHYDEYEYVIINDDLETTYERIKTILSCERLKRHRQVHLDKFVNELVQEVSTLHK